MSASVNYKPEPYRSVTPYLYIDGAAEAIDFYSKAFGAKELMRLAGPDGKIAHAEIKVGDSVIMLADQNSAISAYCPKHYGGVSISLMLYVENVDATFAQAINEGATEWRAIADQFYGDRTGGVTDPFGHQWYLATHIKDVSTEEMSKAMEAMNT